MTVLKHFWICVVLISPKTFGRGDAELCTFGETCILPCTFNPGDHVLVHWIKQKDINVHSYYRDRDQFENQKPQFSGRTMLFKDQLSRGNASLKLTAVTPLDQGRYRCYTSTVGGNKESSLDLNVEAPPREVNMKQEGNVITCSSEGIYPQPELTWTSSPPVTLTPDTPSLDQTQQEIYSISSSLVVSDTDVDYICTIKAGRNSKTATWHKLNTVSTSDTEIELPCMSSNLPSKSLVWRFNQSQIILTQTSSEDVIKVSDEWREYVKSVSDSGSLTLQHITSNQGGTYTCELTTADQKHTKSTELTMTKDSGFSAGAGIAVAVALILIAVGAVLFYKFYYKRRGSDYHVGEQELKRLSTNESETKTSPKTENGRTDHIR